MITTILKNASSEIIEKKSKFIGNIYYVETRDEAEKIILATKKKYYDANHNCYAYSIYTENGILTKSSDDGEPSGTAGAPIQNVISSKKLNNVLAIVTRYFGGVLLGTGGLVKAYSTTTIKAIENAKTIQKGWGYEAKIEIDYKELEYFKYYCKKNNLEITKIEYYNKITLNVEFSKEKLDLLTKNGNTIKEKLIKFDILREKWITLNTNN